MKVIINTLKKYEVVGGLGRLCQFPKTVTVFATCENDAEGTAMNEIRDLIVKENFDGDKTAPMLSKYICFDTVTEI